MHPAIPLATRFLCEHTGTMVQLLEKRSELGHGIQLARMLQQVISYTTATVTEKQIEAILSLTRQTHQALATNLEHYMGEQKNFNGLYLTTTDPLLRAELTAHITNLDNQMGAIRRDMQVLQRFSTRFITICGEAGLKFVRDLSLPYTVPKKIG